MTILVIDDRLQDHIDYELRKSGHRVLHVFDPKRIITFIQQFKPAIVLIGSAAKTFNSFDLLMDIKKYYAQLPVLTYNSDLEGFLEILIPLVNKAVNNVKRPIPDLTHHYFHGNNISID